MSDSGRAPDAVPPVHVVRNVEAVKGMHLQIERGVGAHQRAIEGATALLGLPAALYVVVTLVVAWVVGNVAAFYLGLYVPDPPPFFWLQGAVGLTALLFTSLVLITQRRQAALLERRMHFDLQVNMLTEQKAAKVIELLEELRRDLPNVVNRHDSEAEMLQHAAQAHEVGAALDAPGPLPIGPP